MGEVGDQSFLALLLRKQAAVKKIGAETGINVGPAVKETERQISQSSQGDPITGDAVTKSGAED